MSIWGKLIGGAAGFALGGPIGLIVGVAAGHFVDHVGGRARRDAVGQDESPQIDDLRTKRAAFAIALIVLCAKMAKADGTVTRDEVDAFKRIFRVPEAEMPEVGRIFDEAKREAAGFEPYAEQVTQIFRHNNQVREELLGGLFHIAMADGTLHAAERAYLRRVAEIFGFDERDFERVMASHMGSPEARDPYAILGVERSATDAEIKSTYRTLVRENHPDKLIAQGLPQEMIDVANEKLAAINDAYDRIVKLRELS